MIERNKFAHELIRAAIKWESIEESGEKLREAERELNYAIRRYSSHLSKREGK